VIRVSRHACQRYQQRVEPVTQKVARERILSHSRILEVANAMGARIVRCGDGSRLVLDNSTVITVLGKDMAANGWAT
jgi:hypothetical protein